MISYTNISLLPNNVLYQNMKCELDSIPFHGYGLRVVTTSVPISLLIHNLIKNSEVKIGSPFHLNDS